MYDFRRFIEKFEKEKNLLSEYCDFFMKFCEKYDITRSDMLKLTAMNIHANMNHDKDKIDNFISDLKKDIKKFMKFYEEITKNGT